MTKAALLIALEAVAAVYPFPRSDLLRMSLRELHWWVTSARVRQAERVALVRLFNRA